MPHQEKLDATVVIKRDNEDLHPCDNARALDDRSDELIADESLDSSIFETQDVSVWLAESLFSEQSENLSDSGVAVPNSERSKDSSQHDGLFSDFENDAPEPPKISQVSKKSVKSVKKNTPKTSQNSGYSKYSILESWKKVMKGNNSITLITRCSLLALPVLIVLLVYNNKPQPQILDNSEEPQTLSLLSNVPDLPVEQSPSDQSAVVSNEHYCLLRGIRLGAELENAALLSGLEVNKLRPLFTEFSQQCESEFHVPGMYLQAKLHGSLLSSEVNNQSLTEEERVQATDSLSITSSEIVKNIQWRLVKLGFYAERTDGKGRIDGTFNEETKLAVEAFYHKHSELSKPENEAELFDAIDSVYTKR